MRRTLAHQVWKIVYIVFAEFVIGDRFLLSRIILGSDDLVHPPFVTGSGTQHTSHQMVISVSMCKRMKGVEFIYSKFFAGDEDGSGSSEGNVTSTIAYCSCSDSGSSIVAGAGSNFTICGKTKFCSSSFGQISGYFKTFIKFWKLFFFDIADFHHFLGPAFVLNIHQKHTGSVRVITAVNPCHLVSDIVFWKHDLSDLFEVFRFIFFYPKDFWSSKAGKCDVCGIL